MLKFLLFFSLLFTIQINTFAQESDTTKTKTLGLSHADLKINSSIDLPAYIRFNSSLLFQIGGKGWFGPSIEAGTASIINLGWEYDLANYFGLGITGGYYLLDNPKSLYVSAHFIKERCSILSFFDPEYLFDSHSGKHIFWGEKAMIFIGYTHFFHSSKFALNIEYGIGFESFEKQTFIYNYNYMPEYFWNKEYQLLKLLSVGISYHFNTQKN